MSIARSLRRFLCAFRHPICELAEWGLVSGA